MSDVPPTESIPKPEEPKAPAPAPQQPQFQQGPPPNYYQFPPQGYYPPQGFPNYPPPQTMPYCPNPWMFQQAPPQQFQSQSKRDQDFEEGLNRLRKESRSRTKKYNLGEEVRSHLFSHPLEFCIKTNRWNSGGCYILHKTLVLRSSHFWLHRILSTKTHEFSKKYNLGEEVRSHPFSHLFSHPLEFS
ncbi:hypothetical protein TVAG_137700 [Trichomonas vaginalis G3]|uniref:Uncharacterized protein n=1 Tax=Trichomonas vaginalis (strain ATCC PRA-98 / G3) TaxID=412133 RepID=A2EC05_TRIV3|nr:hypothetical protein TVAGG3_0269130 [Trichomonas vaginalis G3]EAY09780.1 hypothetical protein TVAG_137700 [Trichomonas vaginalis G3]KAI5525722.1 hypothetical protein TVAGG3_0269130 [Trichomonas vaginalis G3]|eukprot:XP_001322003.1 hypothetical protein [Trichomonas vaginalis G3]